MSRSTTSTTPTSLLAGVTPPEEGPPPARREEPHVCRSLGPTQGGATLLPQTSENTVDLRGLRADEALEKIELFLDSVYGANLPNAYIIHGHGTGALKRAVRGYFAHLALCL